jgi:hypothetical protein
MSKERKHYAAEEEVANLHRHLLDKVPVSDLCEELRLQPTVLALAERVFRERGSCLTSDGVRVLPRGREQKRVEFLEKMLQTNGEVLAELMPSTWRLEKPFRELLPRTELHTMRGIRWWISSGAGRREARSASEIHRLAERSQQVL